MDKDFFKRLRIPCTWSQQRVGRELVGAFNRYRAVHVAVDIAPGSDKLYWDTVSAYIGERMAVDEDPQSGRQTDAIWTDISYDPGAPLTFRHSNQAQPLHTDGAYLNLPPPVIFLLCERQAQSGGATLIYDGVELVRLLKKESPNLLDDLYQIKVHFSKQRADPGYYGSILEKTNTIPKITWNYFRVDPRQCAVAKKLADSFHDFLTTKVVNMTLPLRVCLQPGEVIFFHDNCVLHGRESFVASVANERVIWKGGICPGE